MGFTPGGYSLREYISKIYQKYEISSNVTIFSPTYTNVYNKLLTMDLIIQELISHDIYGGTTGGDHLVLCFGMIRFVGNTTGDYLTYINIADGWNTSTRYITLASVQNMAAHGIDFS